MTPLLWERWEGRMEGNEKWQSEVRGTEVCLVRGQILPGHDVPGAFYSEKLPGLSEAGRIVVLNTNLYYSNNERTASMTDPSQQFQWLEDVLTNASRAGEMVRDSIKCGFPLISVFSLSIFPHLCYGSSPLSLMTSGD